MRKTNFIVFPAATNAGGPATSTPVECQVFSRVSGQFVVTGGTGITGTMFLEMSNDRNNGSTPGNFRPTNWSTLTQLPISGPGVFAVNFNELCAEWVRWRWAPSGGSGGTIAGQSVMLGWGSQ